MKISEIMKEMEIEDFEVINEKSFDNMSILLDNRKEKERCVFLSDGKYIKMLDDSSKMVLTSKDLAEKISELGYGVCIVDDPRLMFYRIHNYLSTKDDYIQKETQTIIGENCKISEFTTIPDVNVKIGNNVIIEDRVTLIGHVTIDDDTIIHSGTVIGSAGNDFKRYGDKLIRTSQIGSVKIGRGVEIDPNCCIERPAFPYEITHIGNETKIGALSYISHGVSVGERCQIKAIVNIAGYTTIGNDVFIGPGVTITNLISIGNNAYITIGSVVGQNVHNDAHVTGNFAVDHDLFLMNQLNILRQRR